MNIAIFTFNGFQENTYVLSDETNECVIFDPGCNDRTEQKTLLDFIESNKLKPVLLINTHCHIDHILGNKFIYDTFDLKPRYHQGEQIVMDHSEEVARQYGIGYTASPNADVFLEEDKFITFGNSKLKSIFTPGHSPASLSFYHEASKTLIAGDVLFENSIGRTDLPGGDYDTLIKSIKDKLLVLEDDVNVYPGHGPSTTIGKERISNPFLT